MTKLYEIPRNIKFTIIGDEEKTIFLFHHIDGMYSYCTREWFGNKSVAHIAAWTEVEIVQLSDGMS
jgi:hypothetical protein